MLTQSDGKVNLTTMQYNARNLPAVCSEQGGSPDLLWTQQGQCIILTMRYADGNTDTEADQNGVVTSYTYDIHGRVLSKSAGGKLVTIVKLQQE